MLDVGEAADNDALQQLLDVPITQVNS